MLLAGGPHGSWCPNRLGTVYSLVRASIISHIFSGSPFGAHTACNLKSESHISRTHKQTPVGLTESHFAPLTQSTATPTPLITNDHHRYPVECEFGPKTEVISDSGEHAHFVVWH
jgi:hypothetical protein